MLVAYADRATLRGEDLMTILSPNDIEEIVVRRTRVAVSNRLDMNALALSDVRVDAVIDRVADGLAVRVVAYLAANTIHREVQSRERIPTTWWDAFKLAWFPRWALRRWPAKERTIETEVHFIHMCPHLPQFGHDETVHAVWCARPDDLRRVGRRT
jgi:hypothetical protein